MSLLERVSTLLRANLNDLLDKAEDPDKLSRQILRDMDNQLLQLKTEVAQALADQHRLLAQQREQESAAAEWRRKAELAVAHGEDDLARAALERSLSHARLAEGFAAQHGTSQAEAETLRSAYGRLNTRLTETRARVELLRAEHRRNQAAAARGGGASSTDEIRKAASIDSKLAELTARVAADSADRAATRAVGSLATGERLEDRLHALETNDRIESLLLELKQTNQDQAPRPGERELDTGRR